MCVETLRTGIVFLRWLTRGVTCVGLLKKMNCVPIYLLRNAINVGWNPQHRARFSEIINFRCHMPRFTWKMNVFPSISLEITRNVCWKHQNRAHFSETIDLRAHMPRLTLKNEYFPIYLLRNPINLCWNAQNRAHFSKTIDLRGHMPRFTWKMNVFPSISCEMPEMCVENIRTWLIFLRRSSWGVTCLDLLKK